VKTESPVVVVLTALDVEDRAFRPHLTDLRARRHPKGTFFETAAVSGAAAHVVLATTGEGVVKAGVIAERAIAEFSPAAMLFVGIAGALADDLALGDVVVATRTYAYHGGREEKDGFHARPRAWEADYRLEQLARHVERGGGWSRFLQSNVRDRPAVHFRPIAVGEVVVNAPGGPVADLLNRHFNDAAAIETESAGAAQAAHLNLGVPMITVRGISDHANGEKDITDKAGWRQIAAENAAAFALGLICELDAMPTDSPDAGIDGGKPGPVIQPPLTVSGSGNVVHQGRRIHTGVFIGRDSNGGRA
jgi:adenosylhomocysteine nucleosidase